MLAYKDTQSGWNHEPLDNIRPFVLILYLKITEAKVPLLANSTEREMYCLVRTIYRK